MRNKVHGVYYTGASGYVDVMLMLCSSYVHLMFAYADFQRFTKDFDVLLRRK